MSGRTQPISSSVTHTPLPWRIDGDGIRALIRGADIAIVAVRHRLPRGIHEANAAFIVEAVNNHEALKARIQELESELAICRPKAAARDACTASVDCISRGNK
jgi:hypothetical protein